ncbi:MAG: type II toxin-antitoxin system death-on-curing family toxin [Nitrososphaerota archaeon]
MRFRYLTKEEIIEIHDLMIKNYGGTPGILFDNELELVIDSPTQSFFGKEQFTNCVEKASKLFHELNKLHPFIDGNKRTAYESAKVFLMLNGRALSPPKEEVLKISLSTATCQADMKTVLAWFKRYIV